MRTDHYGRSQLIALNGKILESETSFTPNGVSSWGTMAVPDPISVMSFLRLTLNSFTLSVLIDSGINQELLDRYADKESIACSVILKALGYRDSYDWFSLPRNLWAYPQGIFSALLSIPSYQESKLISFLKWSKPQSLIRLDCDVFRIMSAPGSPILVTDITRKNATAKSKNIRSETVAEKHAHRESELKQLRTADLVTDLIYRSGSVELRLIPTLNRGSVICRVRAISAHNGEIWDLGCIRENKGMMFFHCPKYLVGNAAKDALADRLKEYSARSLSVSDQRKILKKKLSAINVEIIALEKKVTVLSHQIKVDLGRLYAEKQAIEKKLGALNAPNIKIETSFSSIPNPTRDLLLGLFRMLGLNPNNHIKPGKDAPMSSPKYWLENFRVSVIRDDHTKPIAFHKDWRRS